MEGIVVERVVGQPEELAGLLAELDDRHHLNDSKFAVAHRFTVEVDPRAVRLVAVGDGELVGFLSGNLRTATSR
ncbi:hypothetical protein [Nocardia asteroides]|uniref:hypothetical protein n=1 Tax=Nocardia asteroides TaxID=1824 RepID=UPI001E38F8B0|nr:hypothetical protein [Nocardia asteroides]UGT58810.1 hypothetical protein LTT85_33200 [Nocardia asteroides]